MSVPPQIAMIDPYDQLSDEFIQNPYPTYEKLRRGSPIFKSPSAARWLFSSYADVNTLVRDLRLSSSRFSASSTATALMQDERFGKLRNSQSNWMLMKDEPDHTRLRALVNKAFTPATVAGQRGHIESIVNRLLDKMAEKGEADFIADYAYPLPVNVIAAMLGVPNEDHDKFSRWSRALAGAFDVRMCPVRLGHANDATADLADYFRRMVELRRKEPQDDLISSLAAAEEEGSKLSTEEVLDNCILLLFAGHETTVNLIGNGMYALFQHEDQLDKLKQKPALVKGAVEELLRYDSPVQYLKRIALEDIEYAGNVISKTEQVILIIGSAHRDPMQFADADSLDITRSDNKHVALGGGIHYCLGASLARLEAEVAFNNILSRFPNLQLGGDKPAYRDSAGLRGLISLAVRF